MTLFWPNGKLNPPPPQVPVPAMIPQQELDNIGQDVFSLKTRTTAAEGSLATTQGNVSALQQVNATESPNAAVIGLTAALSSTTKAREVRVPGDMTLTQEYTISHDVTLTGDQSVTWYESQEDQGGGLSASTVIPSMFRVTGRDWRSTGGWYQKVGAFGMKNLRLYGAAGGAQRGVRIVAGGGPMSPIVVDSCAFKEFPVAGLHFDMPGGVYAPTANAELANKRIQTGSYLIPIHRSVFYSTNGAPGILATGDGAVGGLDIEGTAFQGNATIKMPLTTLTGMQLTAAERAAYPNGLQVGASYGRNSLTNFQGQGIPRMEISMGLSSWLIEGGYWESMPGEAAYLVATNNESEATVKNNYHTDDGLFLRARNLRMRFDQHRMNLQGRGLYLHELKCRGLYPDFDDPAGFGGGVPFSLNRYALSIFDRAIVGIAPRGGNPEGLTITGESLQSTPRGSVNASQADLGNWATLDFACNAGDTLTLFTTVWNPSAASQAFGYDLVNAGGANIISGYQRFIIPANSAVVVSLSIPVSTALAAGAKFRIVTNLPASQQVLRQTRPYAYAEPGGSPLRLFVPGS